jgi:hypothetical protein
MKNRGGRRVEIKPHAVKRFCERSGCNNKNIAIGVISQIINTGKTINLKQGYKVTQLMESDYEEANYKCFNPQTMFIFNPNKQLKSGLYTAEINGAIPLKRKEGQLAHDKWDFYLYKDILTKDVKNDYSFTKCLCGWEGFIHDNMYNSYFICPRCNSKTPSISVKTSTIWTKNNNSNKGVKLIDKTPIVWDTIINSSITMLFSEAINKQSLASVFKLKHFNIKKNKWESVPGSIEMRGSWICVIIEGKNREDHNESISIIKTTYKKVLGRWEDEKKLSVIPRKRIKERKPKYHINLLKYA